MAMLQVQGGDAIDIKAYAKYNSGGVKNNVGVDGIVSGLVNAFGFNPNSSESGVVLDLFEQANGALGALVAGTGNSDEPEAYLQYLFFDKDFNFVNTVDVGYAYDKVGSAAAVDSNSPVGDHEELHLTRTFTEDGYIFIFVSNSSTGIDVFFDDLTIDYTMNPIDQANDYYPFGGLMGSGFERIISKTNDFRYQGKEYDKDLQWYDFHARQYDPYLGRFLAADPMMQFSSPYNGMGNNPINLIDPTGMGAYNGKHGKGTAEHKDDEEDDGKNTDYVPGSLRDRFLATAASGGWNLRGGGYNGYGGDSYGVNYGATAGGSNVNVAYEFALLQARRTGGKAEFRQGEWGYWVDNDNQSVTWIVENGVLSPTVTGRRSIWVSSQANGEKRNGTSIGVSGTAALLLGATFDIGVVWDGSGDWAPYLAIGSAYGLDASIGVEVKNMYNNNLTPFEIDQYEGVGVSDSYGIGFFDAIYGGNIDVEDAWSIFDHGFTYQEYGAGVSIGSSGGYTRQYVFTWVFDGK